ncbi:MAG TPA: hypothetical protein VMW45_02325 [Dehalococcoidia bacterium]|nr:hypothetical protein [Dehalococcoidia bacterium]
MIDRRNFVFKPGLKDDGKPIIDFRTIPLRAILRLKELPPLPNEYDAHEAVGGVQDDRMFGNDQYGDCVKAAFAHFILTLEKFEQGTLIDIADQEVIDEYLRESGGADSGLYLTLAMKDWRNHGLEFGGKTYTIYSYAGVEPKDHVAIKYSIYLLRGLIFGMQVFSTDIDQFRRDEPWHLTEHSGALEGGHGVYGFKYNDDSVNFVDRGTEISTKQNSGYAGFPRLYKVLTWSENGLTCMTWGEEQFLTWDFWDARVNQAFAVVDNRNKWQGADSPVNVDLNDSYLREITGDGTDNPGCPFPWLGPVKELGKVLAKGFGW